MARYNVVGVATHYQMDGSRFEAGWVRDFPHPSRLIPTPNKPPLPRVSGLLLGGKSVGMWPWLPILTKCLPWQDTRRPLPLPLLFLRQAGKVKVKVKAHPVTSHEGPERELRCSFTLCLTAAIDEVRCSTYALADLTPGKRHVTHCTGGWVGPRAKLERDRNV